MNYYAARQRGGNGRFDYTRMNDGVVVPVGYCLPYRPFEYNQPWIVPQVAEQLNKQEAQFVFKYHDDGHATAEEACACYLDYLLDHSLSLMLQGTDRRRCAVCGEPTLLTARLDMSSWSLCQQHNTRDNVARLHGPLYEIISS